jgi:carbon starvation protein
MAFTTFVYDTLDVCTRLGRYILQELTGLSGTAGRLIATLITAAAPGVFLFWQPTDVPLWRKFWDLFGASNQLLAALTLIGVTVWLWRTYKARWVLFVTGIPCVWMYAMSMWALTRFLRPLISGGMNDPVPWVAVVLAVLGVLIGVEAIRVMLSILPGGRPPEPEPAVAVPA